jgi:hypothetical protein
MFEGVLFPRHSAPTHHRARDVCNVGENPNPSAGGSAGGFGGMSKPPQGKWACEKCTVHNPDALFYCDACEHARPDLASMRF